jgi:hypothetical protein
LEGYLPKLAISTFDEIARILKIVIANGLPIAEEKSEVLINPLIIVD